MTNRVVGKQEPEMNFFEERIHHFDPVNEVLSHVLNEVHQREYSRRYWKFILGNYITAVLSARKVLTSEIIHARPGLEVIISTGIPTRKQKLMEWLRYTFKAFLSVPAVFRVNRLLKQEQHIAMGFHDEEHIQKDAGELIPMYYPLIAGKGDREKRQKLQSLASGYDVFYRNVLSLLPTLYVEHFDLVRQQIPIIEPAKKTFHASVVNSFYNRLLIAEYFERGAKLHLYQHGGNYGEEAFHLSHWFESSIADKFTTWGWKIRENDMPGKAYRLNGFKRNYEAAPKNITSDLALCYPLLSRDNLPEYAEMTRHITTFLDFGKYPRVVARPRPQGKWRNFASELSFIDASRIRIDNGKEDIARLIRRSGIVVQLLHPSTTVLECFFMDHPVLAILNNEYPSDIVKPYYAFFLEKKVFHTSVKSLVDHLNSIDRDIWWRSVISTPQYQEFKNTFLRKP